MRNFILSCFIMIPFLLGAQNFKTNDKVDINRKGTWYSGNILEVKGELYKVSYDGYGAEWNEWVGKDRLQPQHEKPSGPDAYPPDRSDADAQYIGVETIWDLDRSADGKLIFAASAYGGVKILDAHDLSLKSEILLGKEPLSSVSISHDGNFLAIGKMQGGLIIYKKDADGVFSEWTHIDEYSGITRLRFSPLTNELAVSGSPVEDYKKTKVDIWDAEKKTKTNKIVSSTNDQNMYADISWSPDQKFLALAVSNAKHGIEIYDLSTGKMSARIPSRYDVSVLVFSPDGKTIVSGGTDQKVTLWNISTQTATWQNTWGKSGMDYVYGLAFSPDGKSVAVCGTRSASTIEILNAIDGKIVKETGTNNPGGNAIRYNIEGTAVFVAFTTYGNFAKVPIVQKYGIK